MDRSKKRIAVIGGGITGLATAYRLKKQIEAEQLPFELMVLEGSVRTGGNIHTVKMGDRFVDVGASAIDTRVVGPGAKELIRELGLTNQIQYSINGKQDLYVFNELHPLNWKTYKGIPLKRGDIWKYDMLSLQSKLAYLKHTYASKAKIREDKTIHEYLVQRVGEEFAEYIAEPFFSKVFSSDVDELGIRVLDDPIFKEEQRLGKITKAIQQHPEWIDGDGNYLTLKNGLATLTNALTKELEEHIHYSKKVSEIRKSIEGTYILDINHKEEVRVGSVVIATDARSYKKLFDDEKLNSYFKEIKMRSVGHLLLGFEKGAIKYLPEGFGVLAPSRTDSTISSVDWLNKKWPHLADYKDDVLAVQFGHGKEDVVMSLSNSQIEDTVLSDLARILGITDPPLYRLIKRWPSAIPQFTTLNEESRQNVFKLLAEEYPGVYLAGNGINGFGIHACIRQGEEISEHVINHIKKRNHLTTEKPA